MKSENRTPASPDHIYDVPDDTGSQLKYQKKLGENDEVVKDNIILHPTLPHYDMKSNVAYGFIASDGQVCKEPYLHSDVHTGVFCKV